MTEPSTEAAVIDLTNTTEGPLKVTLIIGGVERDIVILAKGESTRQVTPSGVSWVFSPATEEEATEPLPAQPRPIFKNPKGPRAGID